jgi:hypothetical protein
MSKGHSAAITLTVFLALPHLLLAQSSPSIAKPTAAISITLVYHENNSGTFDVRDHKGASLGDPTDGEELKTGFTIVTGWGDVAELKLNHTGTIIRISGNTNFELERLREVTGGQDVFSMAIGKVRTVAGRASTKEFYQIKAGSAVCGVRGSDVVIEVADTVNAKLTTIEGTGWIQNALGKSLDVAQGFAADTAANDFKTFQIPKAVLLKLEDTMKFTKLDVNETNAINKAYQEAQQKAAQNDRGSNSSQTRWFSPGRGRP